MSHVSCFDRQVLYLPPVPPGRPSLRDSEWQLLLLLKMDLKERPWWLSGPKSSRQCKGHGFGPWSEKTPRAVEQPSLRELRALQHC